MRLPLLKSLAIVTKQIATQAWTIVLKGSVNGFHFYALSRRGYSAINRTI